MFSIVLYFYYTWCSFKTFLLSSIKMVLPSRFNWTLVQFLKNQNGKFDNGHDAACFSILDDDVTSGRELCQLNINILKLHFIFKLYFRLLAVHWPAPLL